MIQLWRHDKAIIIAQKGFWLILAVLIPSNPEEPVTAIAPSKKFTSEDFGIAICRNNFS
jgi:hypothetical protein